MHETHEFFTQRKSLKSTCSCQSILLCLLSFWQEWWLMVANCQIAKKKDEIFVIRLALFDTYSTYVGQVRHGSWTQIWAYRLFFSEFSRAKNSSGENHPDSSFSKHWVFHGKKFKWLDHPKLSFSLQWVFYRKKETKAMPNSTFWWRTFTFMFIEPSLNSFKKEYFTCLAPKGLKFNVT